MKKIACLGVLTVCFAGSVGASVTLTSFTGSPNVRGTATFSVNAASSARELWCAWGDSDKGTSFAAWPNNERVCTVPANATTVTSPLPWAARKGAVARFFLFPAGGTYSVSYLVTSGAQAIDTGIVPDPTLKISAELELEDQQTVQQRAFGVDDNPCTVAAYINGASYWAWAFQDNTGNWFSTNIDIEPWRTVITLDGPNNLASVSYSGQQAKRFAIGTSRTQVGTITMAFCASHTASGGYTWFMQDGRFYGGSLSTDTAGAHTYVPYVQAGVAGVKDTVTDTFIPHASGTSPFGMGGRTDATGAEAGDLVHLAKLRTGDVWSDAYYIFNFDTDLNGDGRVQAGEIRNELDFGSTNVNGAALRTRDSANPNVTIYDAATVSGDGLAWRTADIPMPSRGLTHASASYLDFPPNVQDLSGKTNTWRNGIAIQRCLHGEITVVARILVRNFSYRNLGNSTAIFFNNGLDWGRAFGSEFGFAPQTAMTASPGRLYCIQGNHGFAVGDTIPIYTNRWYDVAYSMKNVGNGRCDVTFAASDAKRSDNTCTGIVFYVVRQDTGCFTNENYYAETGRSTYIGGEGIGGWSRGGDGSAQGAKGFNGSIQRLAVWRRALSRDEIAEAFVQMPPLFRVGTENGSSAEFGAADETPDAVNAEFDSWHRFKGTLSAAKPEVTINFTSRADSHRVPYVLRVKAAPGTGDTILMPYLNGTALGSKCVVAGGDQTWFVPANALATGAATLRLRRTGGSAASLAFDVVELNGSAAIGTADDANSEFTQEGHVQHRAWTGQWNWKRYQRATIGGNDVQYWQRYSIFNFWVPPSLVENCQFRYTSKLVGQNASKPDDLVAQYGYVKYQWPYTVRMNGKTIFTTEGSPNLTAIDHTFEPGELQPGWNTISWQGHGEGTYWGCMDFHRLEVIDRPHGTMMLLK